MARHDRLSAPEDTAPTGSEQDDDVAVVPPPVPNMPNTPKKSIFSNLFGIHSKCITNVFSCP